MTVVRKKPRRKTTKKTNIHPTNQIYKTFKASARVLGEVEAGMSALFELLERSGLMRAPAGQVSTMTEEEAHAVLTEARRITDVLSARAKYLIPAVFIAVGDPSALRSFGIQASAADEDETVH